jgi:hypothetical protein
MIKPADIKKFYTHNWETADSRVHIWKDDLGFHVSIDGMTYRGGATCSDPLPTLAAAKTYAIEKFEAVAR